MYERSYGYRYDEQRDLDGPGVAKRIRADIKQAQSEGLLPARWSYSVRFTWATHSWCIDVTVKDCADAWETCDGRSHDGLSCRNVWCAGRNDPAYAHAAEVHQRLTLEADAAKMTLERIHNAYNHDGSEIQTDYFDVNYYGHVTFDDARTTEFRAQEKARLDARRSALESAQVLGRVANYKRGGDKVVHVLVKTSEGKERLACGAAASRFSLFGVKDDEAVTCSRCSKKII